ncbi:MAG: hypothetical protein RLY14_1813 [Planctomycetota bacterium]|jgi:hypothetical protein
MHPAKKLNYLSAILLLMSFLGCGERPPKLVSVEGKVLFEGKPVTAGSIIFHPAQNNAYTRDNPSSLLQLDGGFTMKTFPFGEGVSPGDYTITLSPEVAQRLSLIDCADQEKSPLKINVPDEGVHGLLIQLPVSKK